MNRTPIFSGRRFTAASVATGVVLAVVLLPILTATNTVPATNAGQSVQSTGAPDVEPAACQQNGISPTTIVVGAANSTRNGGAGSDLMLATAGANETLNGRGGNDCLVAGSGGDTLTGAAGTDVCILNGNTNVTVRTCETVVP